LEAKRKEVTTTEGLAPEGELSRLRKLFVEKAAMQYAFCTFPRYIGRQEKKKNEQPN